MFKLGDHTWIGGPESGLAPRFGLGALLAIELAGVVSAVVALLGEPVLAILIAVVVLPVLLLTATVTAASLAIGSALLPSPERGAWAWVGKHVVDVHIGEEAVASFSMRFPRSEWVTEELESLLETWAAPVGGLRWVLPPNSPGEAHWDLLEDVHGEGSAPPGVVRRGEVVSGTFDGTALSLGPEALDVGDERVVLAHIGGVKVVHTGKTHALLVLDTQQDAVRTLLQGRHPGALRWWRGQLAGRLGAPTNVFRASF